MLDLYVCFPSIIYSQILVGLMDHHQIILSPLSPCIIAHSLHCMWLRWTNKTRLEADEMPSQRLEVLRG